MIEVYDNKHTHEDIAEVVAGKAELPRPLRRCSPKLRLLLPPTFRPESLSASFSLEQGKVDWSISPSTDHDAAVEFGHYVYQDARGRRTKRENARHRTWVPGINVMRGVVRAHGGF